MDDEYEKVLLPIIRHPAPTSIFDEIVGVQPMAAPLDGATFSFEVLDEPRVMEPGTIVHSFIEGWCVVGVDQEFIPTMCMNMQYIVQILVHRYRQLTQTALLHGMLNTLEHSSTWPTDKTNRWVGFIQGVLYSEGKINIDNERDFTRPLFHAYYQSIGAEMPESIKI